MKIEMMNIIKMEINEEKDVINKYYKKRNEETKHLTSEEALALRIKEAQEEMAAKNKKITDQATIWNDDEKTGKKKLDHKVVAHILIEDYCFITIGDKISEIYYYDKGIYTSGGEKIIGKKVEELTKGYIRNNDVGEVVGHIKRLTESNMSILETKDINLICMGNGILNIDTLELTPYSKDIIFTQKINWNYIPEQDCPEIKKFLKEIVKEEDIDVIQEFIGYLLYRKYFIKKALILVGEPDTGKTTFIKMIINFIGQENTSGVSLHKILSDKFASSHLHNKLLNFYDDLSFKDVKETGDFKIATGGGYITGEKKFGDQFQFLNYAKLLFATNKISAVDDVSDDAYYNRWIILFFNNEFNDLNKKTDKNIINKITTKDEMEGLLNWALIGLKRLLKNQRFSYKLTADENKLIMERSSNTVSGFVQDVLKEQSGEWISKEMMYEMYSIYVNEYGGARITKEKFGRDLISRALFIAESRKDTSRKKSEHGWLNVTLNTSNTTFSKILYNINSNYTVYFPIEIENSSITSIIKEVSKTSTSNGDTMNTNQVKDTLISLFPMQPEIEIQDFLTRFPEKFHPSIEVMLDNMLRDGEIFEYKPGWIKMI